MRGRQVIFIPILPCILMPACKDLIACLQKLMHCSWTTVAAYVIGVLHLLLAVFAAC